jgi:diguanylate cyclase (GGDEF)-like protein
MGANATRLIKRYLFIVHWFIPDRLRSNPLALSRCQNVVSAAAIAGLSDPFYALFYYLLGFKSATPVILLCGLFMVSAPFLLKLTGRIKIAEEVFVAAVYCNFCWLTYHLGGVEAPTAAWLIICPVVAMLLAGVATGIFWLVMSCLAIVTIYSLEVVGVPMPRSPIEDPLLLQTVCGIGLFVVIVIFVLFFELTKTQGFIKLEQALKTIQELAIRDELTGAFNRRHLLKLMEDEKSRADRLATSFCVCLIDIDYFKRINDTYGHAAGDTVLRTFAKAVEGNIRSIDSFGRYGGEEFLLMLPSTDLDQALALAERVRVETERIDFSHFAETLAVTVSIGIAEHRIDENIALTITRADQALYKAKASGRNCIIRHDSTDKADVPRTLAQLSASMVELEKSDINAVDQSDGSPVDCPGKQEIPSTAAGFAAQVSEGGEAEWRQASLAHYDPMTGLPNRHIFRDRLAHAMNRATRHNLMLALVTLDINKFKELNEALGYDRGDEALITIAERIKKCLRECDTVSRWDGDEFSIIVEDVVDENGVHVVVQKIIENFYEPMILGDAECFLTLSVGIALFPDHDRNIDGLIRKADVAMQRAKAAGQNIYQVYSSDMARVSIDPLTLKSELRHALYRGELFLQYQPQVDIVTHSIVGVEALIRWNHPQLGFIPPNQFIPFAEETGLVIPIGEWVLRTACFQNKQWHDAGLPPIKMAVNLSARQLRHPELVKHVRAIINETGVDPSTVELEITEGLLIDNLHRSKEVISELRAYGIKISIDDFGTGYSSLSYLSELPLDVLKMDGSFVKRLRGNSSGENSYSIAHAIISMAHNMNLKVIAEAVETEEQLESLRRMKCDQMQGYLYSRPVQPSEITEMLEKQNMKSAVEMVERVDREAPRLVTAI